MKKLTTSEIDDILHDMTHDKGLELRGSALRGAMAIGQLRSRLADLESAALDAADALEKCSAILAAREIRARVRLARP